LHFLASAFHPLTPIILLYKKNCFFESAFFPFFFGKWKVNYKKENVPYFLKEKGPNPN